MYRVPFPVSVIRSRVRQEFERNRFVNKLPVVDVLLFRSNADYQVSCFVEGGWKGSYQVGRGGRGPGCGRGGDALDGGGRCLDGIVGICSAGGGIVSDLSSGG